MAATLAAPRYSADDFETTSIRSAAPSYASDVPPYSQMPNPPPYTPQDSHDRSPNLVESSGAGSRQTQSSNTQEPALGLPPIPPVPARSVPSLHNYRIPTWSVRSAPAARQLRSVVERRVNAGLPVGLGNGDSTARRSATRVQTGESTSRPLEDPHLVGERAAAEAKRERLAREKSDILLREDEQLVWLFRQMPGHQERERTWSNFRREVESRQRRTPLQRLGSRLI